jgi:16S rRNA (cytosine1402-N4)-methyltransferase
MGVHQPILTAEVLHGLQPRKGDTVVDGTINRGGHAKLLAAAIGPSGTIVGIDRDADALREAQTNLASCECRVILIEGNYRQVRELLAEQDINKVNHILLDLGLSSDQLESSGRGFSFQKDEPLSMTFESEPDEDTITAATIVNEWSEESLRDIFRGFGEERYPGRIARAICETRKKRPIQTTAELVDIIENVVPHRYVKNRLHPATQVFQALRIAVNDEYGSINDGIEACIETLQLGGRIAIISFHSGEDRIVKNSFKKQASEGKIAIITKKPIAPTREEVEHNPRSRSAKLRIAERI